MGAIRAWIEFHRPRRMLKLGHLGFEPWAIRPALKIDKDGTRWIPLGLGFWLRAK